MNLKPARVLGIETSCDETAAAVVENGREILSSVVATQIDLHAKYGGVFPEVASRQHVRTIYPVIEEALQRANLSLGDIEAIAVTRGPGLAGSLVIGMNAAKGLALGKQVPLIGINHLEGHIYSAWLYPSDTPKPPPPPEFPQMVLLVSGGHTELNLVTDHLQYQHLGATLDDAAGEAFDKVARLLKLPYPGGPLIDKLAKEGKVLDSPEVALARMMDEKFTHVAVQSLHTIGGEEYHDLRRTVGEVEGDVWKAILPERLTPQNLQWEDWSPEGLTKLAYGAGASGFWVNN